MKRPVIDCGKCGGKGKTPLDDTRWKTLQLLARLKRASAPELYEQSGEKDHIGPSALNQRLEDLRKLGLVDREREGSSWTYFPKEQK
jgi:DNA-binding transcriptional ArsR family regulator